MATFVLVHGGAHGGWCWQRVSSRLRAAGHDVHAPTLTGLGERAHLLRTDTGLDTHIADIVGVLAYEDLRDVILVGHSYGGMVITGVADRAPKRIGQLVFLDAAIPRDGENLLDVSPGLHNIGQRDLHSVDGVELVLWPDSDTIHIYGVTDPGDLAWIREKLTPHPWKTFTDPLRLADEAAVSALPRTIVNCASTLRVRPPDRLDRWLKADHVWEIDTGHDMMITEPGAVAEMLLRLA